MSSLYITHCTYKKDKSLEHSGEKVSPDRLYTGIKISRFIKRCKKINVNWAIFSDLYGVWFPDERHRYYEKHPSEVTNSEFKVLLQSSKEKLKKYQAVYFYGNHESHYFHGLYKKLIQALKREGINIIKISSIYDIE